VALLNEACFSESFTLDIFSISKEVLKKKDKYKSNPHQLDPANIDGNF
jgi:hypothetical protein